MLKRISRTPRKASESFVIRGCSILFRKGLRDIRRILSHGWSGDVVRGPHKPSRTATKIRGHGDVVNQRPLCDDNGRGVQVIYETIMTK